MKEGVECERLYIIGVWFSIDVREMLVFYINDFKFCCVVFLEKSDVLKF